MWRSLVAHLTGGQGVAGSNPVIPTGMRKGPPQAGPFAFPRADCSGGVPAGRDSASPRSGEWSARGVHPDRSAARAAAMRRCWRPVRAGCTRPASMCRPRTVFRSLCAWSGGEVGFVMTSALRRGSSRTPARGIVDPDRMASPGARIPRRRATASWLAHFRRCRHVRDPAACRRRFRVRGGGDADATRATPVIIRE